MALHGMFQDGAHFGVNWYITASFATVDDLLNWTTKRNEVAVGEMGADIATPALHVGYDPAFIMFSYARGYAQMMNPSGRLKKANTATRRTQEFLPFLSPFYALTGMK